MKERVISCTMWCGLVYRRSFRVAGFIGLTLAVLLTDGAAEGQPFAFTRPPFSVDRTNVVVWGAVTPGEEGATVWFEWGREFSLGQSSAPAQVGAGSRLTNVTASISGDFPWFYYRIIASNVTGVARGRIQLVSRAAQPFVWGQNLAGTLDPPRLRETTMISGGGNHAIALEAGGRVHGGGRYSGSVVAIPGDLTNANFVASGVDHSLAVRMDGTVVAWGQNSAGQTNVPPGLSEVVAVSGGQNHSLALRRDGTLTGWGQDPSGSANVPAGLSNVVAIVSGPAHNLAIRDNGTVLAWGQNNAGQTNVPAGLSNVVAVAAGVLHSVALRSDGTVVAWGGNSSGQTNVPAAATNVIAVAAGGSHTLALTGSGVVVGWGNNAFQVSTLPAGAGRVFSVAGGTAFSVVARSPESRPYVHTLSPAPVSSTNATVRGMVTPNGLPTAAWFEWGTLGGFNAKSQPVDAGMGLRVRFTEETVDTLIPNEAYQCRLVASNSAGVTVGPTLRFTTGRRVVSWGTTFMGRRILPPAGLTNVVRIAAGDYHGLALTSEGVFVSWGTWNITEAPFVPTDLTNAISFDGGRGHIVAVKADGSVMAWGDNASGQTNVPAGLTDVIAVSAGDAHTLALRKDGSVVGWGALGIGELIPMMIPADLGNVVAISSGDTRYMALRDDGTAVIYGTAVLGSAPVYTTFGPNGTNIIAIQSDYKHNVVLKGDGTIVDQGITAPAGVSNVISIASGDGHTVALKSDGTLVAWGAPAAPPALHGVVAISSGDEFVMALADNTPPQAFARSVNGPSNADWLMRLSGADSAPLIDPNGDDLTVRIVSLPEKGALFQCVDGLRGESISETNVLVTDLEGRVVFSGAPHDSGVPYTGFGVVGNDGEFDSPVALVTVGVVPAPHAVLTALSEVPPASATLTFSGFSNVTYSVMASTNLVNWTRLGAAIQPSPGEFVFSDQTRSNLPARFYRIRSP